jgi:hypothetical protein
MGSKRVDQMQNCMILVAPAVLQPNCKSTQHSIDQITRQLNGINGPYALNESFIADLLAHLENAAPVAGPAYWLTLARLTEAALLCAGHYADNCEFQAAGDLLVNPRITRIFIKGRAGSLIKSRHGRLSDQLSESAWFTGQEVPPARTDACCLMESPALLPYLQDRLVQSDHFELSYLSHVANRMTAIADTIGFLAAWQVDSNETLYRRMASIEEEQRTFILSRLCRFDDGLFQRLGLCIGELLSGRLPEQSRRETYPLRAMSRGGHSGRFTVCREMHR